MTFVIPDHFMGDHRPLAPSDLVEEARAMRCSVAIIHAFSDVESGGRGGFMPDGRPWALYEAHYFHNLTQGKWDRSHPNLSAPRWDRSLYGSGGAHQFDRLTQAMQLDAHAALQSCSLGRFQVMVANWRMVGFASPEDMWGAFCDGERPQLDAFAAFIRRSGLLPDMQANPPKFVPLALGYNGAGEHANLYDQKIEVAWRHYVQAGEGAVPSPVAIIGHALHPGLRGLPLAEATRALSSRMS